MRLLTHFIALVLLIALSTCTPTINTSNRFAAVHQSCSEQNAKKTIGALSTSHSAHSVPGQYPPSISSATADALSYVDADGDGKYTVTLDGRRSHTHYVDPTRNVVGKLVQTIWRDTATNKIISRSLSFDYSFPVGTTRISLTVIDSACNSHTAVTTVRVTSQFQPGMYCYFYTNPNLVKLPGKAGLPTGNNVVYAASYRFLRLNIGSVPNSRNQRYFARCFFQLENKKNLRISLNTFKTGNARLYYDGKSVLQANILNPNPSVTNVNNNNKKLFEFHYVFSTTTQQPKVALLVNGAQPPKKSIVHNRKSVKPVLKALLPSSGTLTGNTLLKLVGYGLHSPLKVNFRFSGGNVVTVNMLNSNREVSSTEVFVRTPKSNSRQTVNVYVTSPTGIQSNQLPFVYTPSTCDGPAFDQTTITTPSKKDVDNLNQPTCVTIGPDNLLYMGTLTGQVNVVGYNKHSYTLTSFCKSDKVVDNSLKDGKGKTSTRAILGIAFNPLHTSILPYVTTSTLNWWSDSTISRQNKAAWRNGAVDRLRLTVNSPKSLGIGGKRCLTYDKRIVTGLPVGNGGSHSVNALLFTSSGDLLIAVGGVTNMGLPGRILGNIWGSPLSGAIVIARVTSRGNKFNGQIKYKDGDKTYTAKQISSTADIDVYAPGFRNIFTITRTLNDEIYGIDQGPGCPLGGPATSCADFNRKRADAWDIFNSQVDWPSKVKGSESQCTGFRREDKLVKINSGKFYGHANINRGQCKWIDPLTGKSADGQSAPSNYKPPMTMLPASATSVLEYSSSHFCGAMRGDLVASTFRGVSTWRIKLSGNRNNVQGVDVLAEAGGTSFVEDIMGNLVFPRFTKKKIDVFQPIVSNWIKTNGQVKIVNVYPKWHRRAGSTKLFIGGYSMNGKNVRIWVGKAACTSINVLERGREAECIIPSRAKAGADVVDVRIAVGGKQFTLSRAMAYMKV